MRRDLNFFQFSILLFILFFFIYFLISLRLQKIIIHSWIFSHVDLDYFKSFIWLHFASSSLYKKHTQIILSCMMFLPIFCCEWFLLGEKFVWISSKNLCCACDSQKWYSKDILKSGKTSFFVFFLFQFNGKCWAIEFDVFLCVMICNFMDFMYPSCLFTIIRSFFSLKRSSLYIYDFNLISFLFILLFFQLLLNH